MISSTAPVRIAVLDDYLGIAQDVADWTRLSNAEVVVFTDHVDQVDELIERLAGFTVVSLMRERTSLSSRAIEQLVDLRLIVTTGMYNASVDVAAADRAGIVVCGTETGVTPTVELTWALILAAARGVPRNDRDMRSGDWQRHLGIDLHGRRLGVIGLGRNGSMVARIGLAFGMDVVAWSQNLTDERAAKAGVRWVAKDELLATSSIVTIHLRHSDRTNAILGRPELSLLRDDAILVNTSRGPIVDEDALLEALRANPRLTAALDVYDQEPLPVAHPFRSLDNVILSPHVGYVSEANMRLFYGQTVEDIAAWLAGSPIRILGNVTISLPAGSERAREQP